ncbi:PH domain-containing protein [Demequina oxidasica]|uniref:PH domain-containing protein n=1 Tax=Demequina oxidasica TaxID=676199 RepID=UPI000781B9D8|nr:PH domain-containing protein [Demequina oxidasica]
MGYPEDNLVEDERIIIHSRTHWKALIAPVFFIVVITALVIFAWTWANSQNWSDGAELAVMIILGVIWLIVAIWLFAVPVIRWATNHFVVTTRRVMFRTGVLSRSGIDIPVSRINSVQFRHGMIDRMFRTGTLIIESASDDPLSFEDIPNVERVHSLLYQEVSDTQDDDDDRDRNSRR